MTDHESAALFVVTFDAGAGDIRGPVKRFLKLALRYCGLRCVRIETKP